MPEPDLEAPDPSPPRRSVATPIPPLADVPVTGRPPDVEYTTTNRLLRAMPREGWEHLRGSLEVIHPRPGRVLHAQDRPATYAYFPERAVISFIPLMHSGGPIEVASVGSEGMLGVPIVLGGEQWPARAVVQTGDGITRIPADVLRAAIAERPRLRLLLLRYTATFMNHLIQSAACNGLHSAKQRYARWLLMTHDRLGAEPLLVKQRLLSELLGVRRETVTMAAGLLQRLGLVHYSRGRISITDRSGLEAEACECYRVIRAMYQHLLEPADR
jgi:CRP-like cAMP-binding protein